MQFVRIAWRSSQLPLHLVDRRRVEEVPELLLAEQLAKQVTIEGECTGAALGERCVALVHVGGDVVEQQG